MGRFSCVRAWPPSCSARACASRPGDRDTDAGGGGEGGSGGRRISACKVRPPRGPRWRRLVCAVGDRHVSLLSPHVHPVLVHFAFALTLTAVASFWLARLVGGPARADSLRHAGDWTLAFAGAAIVLTLAAGFVAANRVAHDAPSHAAMLVHRNWAVASGLLILAVALWRWRRRAVSPSWRFVGALSVVALGLMVTAWHGGTLVYGHGLGVERLPESSSDGHDHVH
ncbi:hypothetical protein CCR85_03885 [Rhodothalassium salexigens]|nr:hypothetical protein [Rhodothalassium salexigens]